MKNILENNIGGGSGVGSLDQLGIDATAQELNYIKGATSNIQDQIDAMATTTAPIDYDLVLLADNWVGEEAPYTYDLTFEDHTNTKDKIAIMTGDDATVEEVAALQSINIASATWVNKTTLQLKAYGEDKATIDIPINLTISSISMKFADDSSMLVFRDMVVPTRAWKEDFTYAVEGFGYSADIVCEHVTEEYMPEVTFGVSDSACGNFSSNAATFENVVRIYAKKIPSGNITIPTITCTIAAARLIGGTGSTGSGVYINANPPEDEAINMWLDTDEEEDESYPTTAEVRAMIDGTAGMQMDLLWENASPTSSFAEQTINLDLSSYKFVAIDFRATTDWQVYRTFIYSKMLDTLLYSTFDGAVDLYIREIKLYEDSIFFKGSTKAKFGTSGSTANNACVIPQRIYGIK